MSIFHGPARRETLDVDFAAASKVLLTKGTAIPAHEAFFMKARRSKRGFCDISISMNPKFSAAYPEFPF
jgi:hypothetical protein